jgi:hypothetical protein
MRDIGKRVTSKGALKTHDCRDISSANLIDFFALVSMHTNYTSDTLFFTGCGIENV